MKFLSNFIFRIKTKAVMLLCEIYSFYEDTFLKESNSTFLSEPCLIGNIKEKLDELVILEVKGSNPYQKINIIGDEQLRYFIKNLFNDDFKRRIELITGYKYSIDFFVFNHNFNVEINNRNRPIYANLWHIDSTFTTNCLKIFIPIKEIDISNGPLHYLDSRNSQKLISSGFPRMPNLPIEFEPYIGRVCGSKGDIFLVNPRTMLHKAGIPEIGKSRLQIMIQLNPSKRWKVNEELFKRQYKVETNLPFIRNFFSKYYYL